MVDRIIMDKEAINKALAEIAEGILKKNSGVENLALIGIQTNGTYLADRLANHLSKAINGDVLTGKMDVTLYRDDGSEKEVKETDINFDINNKRIILVDDVIYTGRTIRCALNHLMDYGRPRLVQLAVLVNRGHRELPIHPDYVGKNIPSAKTDKVKVKVYEKDDIDKVIITNNSK